MKVVLFFLCSFAAFTAQAQLFKCIDAQGRITYQDVACDPGQQVGTVPRDTTPADLRAMERIREERKELDAAYEARQARESAERLAAAEIALREKLLAVADEPRPSYQAFVAYPLTYPQSKPHLHPHPHTRKPTHMRAQIGSTRTPHLGSMRAPGCRPGKQDC